MRNLYLLNYVYQKDVADGDTVEAFYFDEFSSSLYLISKGKTLFVLTFRKGNYAEILDKKEIPLDSSIKKNEVVISFQYIQEIEAIVVVCESGEIFKVSPGSEQVDNVGSIEGGLHSAKWSPNEEKLALATKEGRLLILDAEFEPKCETTIDDGDETGDPETLPISSASISWRGDAKFLTVIYGTPTGKKALTRDTNLTVFKSVARADAEGGVVKSVSEKPVKVLETLAAYQPNGSLIAGVERSSVQVEGDKTVERVQVVFWEKNGLRHGEFNLPSFTKLHQAHAEESDLSVQQIDWSKDSDIFGLKVLDGNMTESIVLCIRSNYKWYIKKVLSAPKNQKILSFQWSVLDNLRLYVTYKSGGFEVLEFCNDYGISGRDSGSTEDLAWAASVDLGTLLLTPLGKLVIPPPMCKEKVETGAIVEGVYQTKNTVAVINRTQLKFYEMDADKPKSEQRFDLTLKDSSNLDRIRLFTFLKCSQNPTYYGLVLFLANDGSQKFLHKVLVKRTQDKNLVIAAQKSVVIDLDLVAICPSAAYLQNEDPDYVLLHTADGRVVSHRIEEDFVAPDSNEPFDYDVQMKSLPDSPHFIRVQELPLENRNIIVGLTGNMRLYIDTKLISSECTSFYYHNGFLLFTTLSNGLSHLLFLYKISEPAFQNLIFSLSPQVVLPNPESTSHHVRCVERGSRIVCVHKEKLVLQMPRGNLEGITPRLLVLHQINFLIKEKKYRESFELLRKHRLDLNLLFDLNPEEFVKNVDEIVGQIEKIDYLNLLLTATKEEINPDVSYVLTPEEHKASTDYLTQAKILKTKVKLVSECIRQALQKLDKDKYVLTIMTSYVKEDALEIVLDEIVKLKSLEGVMEEKEPVPPHLNPQTMHKFKHSKKIGSKEVIEYVCWLADANKLYEVALSTYNLDVTVMVAQQTQKDPKEYNPYIESLRKMTNSIDMKAKINIDLKNYGRAAEELSKGDDSQIFKAVELIKEHKLFALGVKLFTNNQKISNEINNAFAKYVFDRKDYTLASMLYEQAGNYEAALEVYKVSFEYQKYLHTLPKLNLNPEKYKEKVLDFHSELISQNKYSEAAEVKLSLPDEHNLTEIASLFIKAHNWTRLLEIAHGNDQIKSTAIQALTLEYSLRTNALTDKINTYIQKKQRLAVVQENKRMMPMLLGDPVHGILDSDVMSEVSDNSMASSKKSRSNMSVRSSKSAKSTASSRSKKPSNLMQRNVKEGSVFEEDFLVHKLNEYKVNPKMKEDYEGFFRHLIAFGLIEQAEKLLELFEKYTNITNEKFKTIKQKDFEIAHPELHELYPENEDFKPVSNHEPYQSATFRYLKFYKSKNT